MTSKRRYTSACSPVPQAEVVTDLSIETFLLAIRRLFLLAIRRFTGGRSLPQIVVSDNASTYLAAADELKQLRTSHRRIGKERRAMAIHPQTCPLVQWVVGAPYQTDENVTEESTREIKDQSNRIADISSGS